MNSTVIEKIKKLFSLANSDNPHERDLALAKAQRIATENNVDLALLDLSDAGTVKEEEMVEDKFSIGKQLSAHKRFVSSIVTEVCGVEVVYWNHFSGRQISFLGPKSSVEFAKWLYGYLVDEYVRRWNYERKANNLPAAHRNTFYLGVYHGQRTKIREEKAAAESEAIQRRADKAIDEIPGNPITLDATVRESAEFTRSQTVAGLTQKYALVVQDQTSKRKEFLNKLHPRLGTLRSTNVRVRCHDTYSSGSAHGRSIGLNRPLN